MRAGERLETDYYATLGISAAATESEIRKAYRRLALEWHPDRNPHKPDATERFKEISEAYAVLIDPVKRSHYDRSRQTQEAADFQYSREDIFRDLFTNPSASSVFEELAREFERMGMRVDRYTFEQTLHGGKTFVTGGVFVISPLTMFKMIRAARAALSGAKAALPEESKQRPAPSRYLSAIGRFAQRLLGLQPAAPESLAGVDDVIRPLRVGRPEAEMGGRSRVRVDIDGSAEELLVTLPAGVRSGTRLRLRGKGRQSPRGSRGDLYLVVEVVEH